MARFNLSHVRDWAYKRKSLVLLIVILIPLAWSCGRQSVTLTAAPGKTMEAEIPTKYLWRRAWIEGKETALHVYGPLSMDEAEHLTQDYHCLIGEISAPYIENIFPDSKRSARLTNECDKEVTIELWWFNFNFWNRLFFNS